MPPSPSASSLQTVSLSSQGARPPFSRQQTFPPGRVVIQQDAPARKAFYVVRGLLKLSRLDRGGREVIVGLRQEGSFLGAEAVTLHLPYPVTATPLSSCCLAEILADEFMALADSHPGFTRILQVAQSRELYSEVVHVGDLAALPARERLLRLFERFVHGASPDERGLTMLRVPLKQWEIAQLVAVTPPYLSHLMAQLQAEGTLRRDRDSYWLRQRLE